MTVATGTIHGLIFYANILTANYSVFLPFATPNFLTVFISWLNLDLGIEICFYDGMDSYGKFLLQLVFPIYVFVLIGTIIVLCEVSKKFGTLLGTGTQLLHFVLIFCSPTLNSSILSLQLFSSHTSTIQMVHVRLSGCMMLMFHTSLSVITLDL